MSNTRRATDSERFRQERFCSSTEFERGLMGNLVAKRCSVTAKADRELIWWLQCLSHCKGEYDSLYKHLPGGLGALVNELLRLYHNRMVTPSMKRFGTKPKQIYNADQVRAVRSEIEFEDGESNYPLRGDKDQWDTDRLLCNPERPDQRPTSYGAQEFKARCLSTARNSLAEYITTLCLNPAMPIESPWYFPTLIATLREYQSAITKDIQEQTVVTRIGRQVYDALDFCIEERCLVLVDGRARTGKSFSAKRWAELRPGRARYVEVPATSDDIGFFKAVAESLGVSINQNSKAQQLRDRVEGVLHSGDLALILDEAHHLWPQSNYRDALPSRVNWVMSLVNREVPVALVTTPQFLLSQKTVEKKTCWTSEQFTGRIGHYEALAETLLDDDLAAVATALLPHADTKSIETLVEYAKESKKYLAGIEWAVKRARFVAKKEGRDRASFRDIGKAIEVNILPSDVNLYNAISDSPKRAGKQPRRQVSMPVQDDCNAPEKLLRGTPESRTALKFTGRNSGLENVESERLDAALVG